MSQLKIRLRTLMAIVAALTLLVCAVPVAGFTASGSEQAAETLETVSSYPYTTKTKVKVNLRASRSTRSTLLKKIPADAEITVNAVKGSWAEVQYKKYSGYVKTDYIVLKEVKKVKPTPTPTPVVTLSPEEDAGGYNILQKGAEGREVTALQEALIELGFLNGKADGKFGATTEKAVIAFQQKNDYPATGIMDANIQAFLYSGQPKNAAGTKTSIRTLSPVAEVSMKKGNKGEAVTELQQKLIELGYLKGTPSGTYDTDTIGAVRSFQKKNGLTSNGTADAATRQLIMSGTALGAKDTATPTVQVTPSPTPTVPIPAVSLRNGDKGDDVKQVQKRLKELGYYKSSVDGKMGKGTVNALKEFQKAHGLTDDGVAGQATYAVLFSNDALKKGTTPTPQPTVIPTPAPEVTAAPNVAVSWPTLRKDDSGTDVAQLQEALIQLGYLSGKADGNYGAKTVEAVRAFQKATGLTADGTAGEQTQRVLYGGNAKAASVKTTAAPQQAAATTTAAPAASGTLKVGSTGTDVQTLQQKLIELGYLKGSADGVFGNKTAAAVKAYQKASNLTADGVAGSQTLSSLNAVAANKNAASSNTAASTTAQKTTVTPSAARVQYANWYEKVKSVARSYPYATVYDIGTGISWQVHIFSLGAHADYEPVTANDTARMEKVFGGNTWNPRAVWVIFSDGSIYIGSTHSMPHEVQHVRDNNFNGHSCLHFPRTQEQVTSIGPYATKHQETIDAGWAVTQKMK
ncbi:MAG: peptidoglycan-binding protein [Clostridia bacterium]|nr:peptidoglycan-binding protein [Clostridia bacterium]